MTALILFDVDRTLVHNSRFHRASFIRACTTVTGREIRYEGFDANGRCDKWIVRKLLEQANYPVTEKVLADCMYEMVVFYKAHVSEDAVEIVHGVPESLEYLKSKGYSLGLITGNVEDIAYAKLERAGLRNFFSVGGFGDSSEERDIVVRNAITNATAHYRKSFDYIYVVGDTPHDIDAAHKNKVTSIGVATGKHSIEQLTETGADIVISRLPEIKKYL